MSARRISTSEGTVYARLQRDGSYHLQGPAKAIPLAKAILQREGRTVR